MHFFSRTNLKLSFLVVAVILLSGVYDSAEAQLKRRSVKKNNRRISKYRGSRNTFTQTNRYSYAGVTLNALNYFGDLAPLNKRTSTDIKFTRPAFGATFGTRFGPFYTLRAQFTYGVLRGSDYESADPNDELARFRYVRNLHFRNPIKELSITGVFDLFKNGSTYINRVQITPYAYLGGSLYHHNPKAFVAEDSGLPEAGTWVALQPLGTEGQHSDLPSDAVNFGIKPYKRLQFSIPLGIGVRYRINDKIDASFETGTRYLFTDYIDDVSANYVDLEHLNSDLARAMSDRSRELTDAVSGETRNAEVIATVAGVPLPQPGGYMSYGGYGREYVENYRGKSKDNDMYFVTTVRVTYIIGKSYRRAKFR